MYTLQCMCACMLHCDKDNIHILDPVIYSLTSTLFTVGNKTIFSIHKCPYMNFQTHHRQLAFAVLVAIMCIVCGLLLSVLLEDKMTLISK